MSNWLKVELKIKPPFLTNQQGALRFGLDAQTLRIKDQPVILGSLIKGNLREILEPHIADKVAEYFGKEKANYGQAKLIFSYFWKLKAYSTTSYNIRPRIKIGEEGAVGDKMLRFAEVLDTKEPDNLLIFTGYIYARNPNEDLIELTEYLTKGLKLIPAIGSNKGIGYGAIQDIEIKEIKSPVSINTMTESESTNLNQAILETRKFKLGIQPLWPVCFPHTSIKKENNIISKDHIPGEVIKGALAKLMSIQNQSDDIKLAFDAMTITQGLFTKKGQPRPKVVPLSTISIKETSRTIYRDIAKDNIFNTQLINDEIPKFQPDWKTKDFNQIDNIKPERILQVRNAHDIDTRAAQNEKLFSMESLLPDDAMEWRSQITLPQENAEALLTLIRKALEKGLYPLGKTNAPADIEIKPLGAEDFFNTHNIQQGDTILITLQSDAQLFAPKEAENIPYTGGTQALANLYKKAWNELSENSLEYLHSYSQQHLKGGDFWHKHFNKNKNPYQPQIFINKGSIFCLKITTPEEAKKYLDDWQDYGLKAPKGISTNWEENPWIRENGYAEIHIQKLEDKT